jgi:hypothetical protein
VAWRRINRWTFFLFTIIPARRSSAVMRGTPYAPSAASKTSRINATNSASAT